MKNDVKRPGPAHAALSESKAEKVSMPTTVVQKNL